MTESFNRKLGRLAQSVSGTGTITTNAATASAWQTARTITLGGDLSGNVSIDGTQNVTLTATVSGDSIVLGTDTTGNYVAAVAVSGTGLSVSGSGENAIYTITSNATSANTASAIVARDASGNFSAGTITAALSGNATTATTLQTARTINGVSFDGSGNITVTAAAGTLTGNTLASGVTSSSLTSVGTLSSLTVSGNVGIGTTSPGTGYRLHIVDSGNTVGTNTPLFLSSANGVATTSYGWDNLTSSYDYTIKVNGSTTALTISNTGNVGIGTTAPSRTLHLYGTDNTAVANNTFWNFSFVGQEITNASNTANTVAGLVFVGGTARTAVSAIAGIQESTTLGALAFFTGGSGRAGTVPERMRITSEGNVGIGTAAPDTQLTINRASDTAAFQQKFNIVGGVSAGNYMGIVWTQNTSTELASIRVNHNNNGIPDLVFGIRDYPSRIVMKNDGNVGIGTTAPAHRLHVVGSARADAFITFSNTIGGVSTSPVTILTLGNETSVYILSVTAVTEVNGFNFYSSAAYIVTVGAWSKTIAQIGNTSNHFGVGTVSATLSETSAANSNIRVQISSGAGTASVTATLVRIGVGQGV